MKKYAPEKIVLDVDGSLLICLDGKISSATKEQRSNITEAHKYGYPTQFTVPYGEVINSDMGDYWGNKIGFIAALFHASKNRVTILEAPPEILHWVNLDYAKNYETE